MSYLAPIVYRWPVLEGDHVPLLLLLLSKNRRLLLLPMLHWHRPKSPRVHGIVVRVMNLHNLSLTGRGRSPSPGEDVLIVTQPAVVVQRRSQLVLVAGGDGGGGGGGGGAAVPPALGVVGSRGSVGHLGRQRGRLVVRLLLLLAKMSVA